MSRVLDLEKALVELILAYRQARDARSINIRVTRRRKDAEPIRRFGTALNDAEFLVHDELKAAEGEKNGRAILNYQSAAKIREMYAAGGVTQDRLAEDFGVCSQTIRAVLKRQTWPDVAPNDTDSAIKEAV